MLLKQYKVMEGGIEYDVEENSYGSKYWYYKGKLHREYGPAIEYLDGPKEYWLNSIQYSDITSDDEWIIFNIIT